MRTYTAQVDCRGSARRFGTCSSLPMSLPSPPIPPGWLPSAIKDLSNTNSTITQTGIEKAIGSCRNDLAVGQDGITYRMVGAVYRALPNELLDGFSYLLMHGVVWTVWKTAKWVPIRKTWKTQPRRTRRTDGQYPSSPVLENPSGRCHLPC